MKSQVAEMLQGLNSKLNAGFTALDVKVTSVLKVVHDEVLPAITNLQKATGSIKDVLEKLIADFDEHKEITNKRFAGASAKRQEQVAAVSTPPSPRIIHPPLSPHSLTFFSSPSRPAQMVSKEAEERKSAYRRRRRSANRPYRRRPRTASGGRDPRRRRPPHSQGPRRHKEGLADMKEELEKTKDDLKDFKSMSNFELELIHKQIEGEGVAHGVVQRRAPAQLPSTLRMTTRRRRSRAMATTTRARLTTTRMTTRRRCSRAMATTTRTDYDDEDDYEAPLKGDGNDNKGSIDDDEDDYEAPPLQGV